MLNKFNSIATAVVVSTPAGIPLVKDDRMSPAFWKFPGGKGEASETAEECAIRELYQETGIQVDFFDLEKVCEEDRGNHKFVLFLVKLSHLPKLNFFGDEGELVEVFRWEVILGMKDFFPNHLGFLEQVMDRIR